VSRTLPSERPKRVAVAFVDRVKMKLDQKIVLDLKSLGEEIGGIPHGIGAGCLRREN
jgi:hypothetical protein